MDSPTSIRTRDHVDFTDHDGGRAPGSGRIVHAAEIEGEQVLSVELTSGEIVTVLAADAVVVR